ncbi:MAG: hypothetical protein JW927_05620 [Deltaproteobacteria bacterium]|nr:hypothetical protein [Deltaproteobacteria bacterium]
MKSTLKYIKALLEPVRSSATKKNAIWNPTDWKWVELLLWFTALLNLPPGLEIYRECFFRDSHPAENIFLTDVGMKKLIREKALYSGEL